MCVGANAGANACAGVLPVDDASISPNVCVVYARILHRSDFSGICIGINVGVDFVRRIMMSSV